MAANTIRVRFITSMISYSARTARAIQLELSAKQNESQGFAILELAWSPAGDELALIQMADV